MQIKTCVHALLHSKKVYHLNLMDSNLSLLHHSFIGGTLPEVTDYATSTNFLTLAGQLVNIINNASINNIPQLTLASGEIKGDCIGCLQNYATANFDNPSVSNLAPQYEWDISFYVTADYNVSGGGGGGSSIDYTNILTSINSNLAALVSKNNQSEITQKLSDIFEYTLTDNSKVSSMRLNVSGSQVSSSEYNGMNIVMGFMKIVQLLSNTSVGWSTGVSYNSSILQDIRKCLKYIVPANDVNNINSNIYRLYDVLINISNKLSETVSSVDIPLLKEIALAISSLASASDNQAIKDLKGAIDNVSTNINNKDNVLIVDGTQTFEFRPKDTEV